jgi:hypothetical protein
MGSLEITELIRRHLRLEVTSPVELPPGGPEITGEEVPPGAPGAAISSLLIPEQPAGQLPSSFWMNINAELVLYGATEPTARVKIGAREIRLRADGTFSYRFALPDGEYPLVITAAAADLEQRRAVALQFSRRTQIQGEVGKHPQDPRLQPPLEKNIQ